MLSDSRFGMRGKRLYKRMNSRFPLLCARLEETAILPTRKHESDAGADVYSLEDHIIKPHSIKVCRTGVTVEVPEGFFILVKPKSKNNHLVGAGVIDSGYQGEVLVKVVNVTDEDLVIKNGDAIGQLVFIPIFTPAIVEVSKEQVHKTATERGRSGGIVGQEA